MELEQFTQQSSQLSRHRRAFAFKKKSTCECVYCIVGKPFGNERSHSTECVCVRVRSIEDEGNDFLLFAWRVCEHVTACEFPQIFNLYEKKYI